MYERSIVRYKERCEEKTIFLNCEQGVIISTEVVLMFKKFEVTTTWRQKCRRRFCQVSVGNEDKKKNTKSDSSKKYTNFLIFDQIKPVEILEIHLGQQQCIC